MANHRVLQDSGAKNEQYLGRRLRIAYVTAGDSNDRRSWSGTLYYMARALERHCGQVVRIGPLQPVSAKVGKLIHHGIHFLTGRTYLYTHTTSLSKELAKMAERQLSEHECDVIFAPAGSAIVAHLRTDLPIVYLSDTTLKLMLNYNSEFSDMFRSHIRMADELEKAATGRASQLIYPSSWAARSAEGDYGADRSRIHIVPFGANLDCPPNRREALKDSAGDRCRLLFVGVNWQQKGGDIAFETLLQLEELGIAADLTVVGCTPPSHIKHPHLHVFPFLNKNDDHERAQLNYLYRTADFFILPTRAECFSIALCEANAYGIPVVSTETGGLPDLVRNGVNGFLLPLEARGDQYAARISDTYGNRSLYDSLRVSSREEFETRLNWDAWGKQVNEILRSAVILDRAPRVDRQPS